MEDKEFEKLTDQEKRELFQQAVDNYNHGFIEEDYVIKSLATVRAEDAMEDAGRVWEEFKPGQRKIIYEAAEADVNLDYFMNPKFSCTHMKFLLEQLKAGKDVTWLPVGMFHENIVRRPLTKVEIANIRKRMGMRESVMDNLAEKKMTAAKLEKKEKKIMQRGER